MTPDDPYPAVRRLLDEVDAPAVRPVDVPAVYAAAAALQARRLRRWKWSALVTAAAAAGVLVFAVLPRFEVRAGGGELVVRWDSPPKGELEPVEIIQMVPADRTADRLAALEARAKELDDLARAHQELKDLLLVVAADVNTLDAARRGSTERQRELATWVSSQLRDVDGKLAEVRKDQTAMYTLVTDRK